MFENYATHMMEFYPGTNPRQPTARFARDPLLLSRPICKNPRLMKVDQESLARIRGTCASYECERNSAAKKVGRQDGEGNIVQGGRLQGRRKPWEAIRNSKKHSSSSSPSPSPQPGLLLICRERKSGTTQIANQTV